MATGQKKPQKKSRKKPAAARQAPASPLHGLWDAVKTISYAVILTLFFRTLAYEPFAIPSGSMLPTLLIGDYLFVSKFSYGYSRFSMPFSPELFEGRVLGAPEDIKRGDVAVFRLPSDTKRDFIKRVVGLPGDRIQVTGGILHINDRPVTRDYVDEVDYWDSRGVYSRVTEYVETLPSGVSYRIWERSDEEDSDNTGVFFVPPGHYFMMGDNRDFSEDSRFLASVGYIPHENFIGRAEFLFYSYRSDEPLWKFWTWPTAVRWERLFKGID